MRKLSSFLFMSLDGVVEAPDRFARPNLYADFPALIGQTIAEQDAVLLGRKQHDEWSGFWPGSDLQPFADFINNVPKFIISTTLAETDWQHATILSGPMAAAVTTLKRGVGGTIGVHGSISLVQALLGAGLLDELRFILCPVMARSGRRLVSDGQEPIQLDLQSVETRPSGLQYLIYRPF